MLIDKLEPRFIAPAGNYTRNQPDERSALDVKIYKMHNPFCYPADSASLEVIGGLGDYLSNLPDAECYDHAGFAVISTFAPAQKMPFTDWVTLGIWDRIIPRRTTFEVKDGENLLKMPRAEADWCIYEILGVVQFEAKAWAKYLDSEKKTEDLTTYLNSHHPLGLLELN